MGNCRCELHFHGENEATAEQLREGNKNNTCLSVNREFITPDSAKHTQIKEKENEIKQKLIKKLPEIGKEVDIKNLENLIDNNTIQYIKNNTLNYKKYYPKDFVTYKSNPVEFKNGNIYSGNWNENCQLEGYGIYYMKDKDVVAEGVWIKGNLIYGRIFLPSGDIYEGEILNNVFNGKGKIIFSDGSHYRGDFVEGEMTGNGEYIFSDKTIYSGNFKNSLFNGIGKMNWVNGTEYHGNFVDSFLCGNGKIKNLQGETFEGNFEKNEFNGVGKYLYRNGDVYEGNFTDGVKSGKGLYKRRDNVVFEGIWNNDLPDGQGVITYNDTKIKGYWRNGLIVGNPQVLEGSMEKLNDIDLNISPCKPSIYPVSLPHLNSNDVNSSQFTTGKEMSFLL